MLRIKQPRKCIWINKWEINTIVEETAVDTGALIFHYHLQSSRQGRAFMEGFRGQCGRRWQLPALQKNCESD